MAGWLQFQERVLFEVVKRPEMLRRLWPAEFFAGGNVQNLPAKTPIPQQSRDILILTVAAVAKLSPLEASTTFPHGGVVGIGIVNEVGLTWVEIDHAIPNVHPHWPWHCITPLDRKHTYGRSPTRLCR